SQPASSPLPPSALRPSLPVSWQRQPPWRLPVFWPERLSSQLASSLRVFLLLLPFASPSRDGKSSYKIETRPTHRAMDKRIIHRHKQTAACANEYGTS
ncbi:MAG: hypothetical protein WBG17_09095, partial [Burkholderiaceae bacterium]